MRNILVVLGIVCLVLLLPESSFQQNSRSSKTNTNVLTFIEVPNTLHAMKFTDDGQVLDEIKIPLQIPAKFTDIVSSSMYLPGSGTIGVLVLWRNVRTGKSFIKEIRFTFDQTSPNLQMDPPVIQRNVPTTNLVNLVPSPGNSVWRDVNRLFYNYRSRVTELGDFVQRANQFTPGGGFDSNSITTSGPTPPSDTAAVVMNADGSYSWLVQCQRTTARTSCAYEVNRISNLVRDRQRFALYNASVGGSRFNIFGAGDLSNRSSNNTFSFVYSALTGQTGSTTLRQMFNQRFSADQSGLLSLLGPRINLDAERIFWTNEVPYQSVAVDPEEEAYFLNTVCDADSCRLLFQRLLNGRRVGPSREFVNIPAPPTIRDLDVLGFDEVTL